MIVLVTGGAGFIGSAFCRRAVADLGWSVVNLDKLTYSGNLQSLTAVENAPNYQFVHGDIADANCLSTLFSQFDFDAVVNFAAETHVDRSISSAQPFIDTNVMGVYALLQATLSHWEGLRGERRRQFRFLQVSTDEVFGSLSSDGRFTELSRYDPRSPYSASKAAGDHLVAAWGETYGLPVLISHCSNNYGPYQFPEKLIPLAILRAMQAQPIPVYGDGLNVRDWLHVDDHVEALRLILSAGAPGRTYNVGADTERTNLEVVHEIIRLVGTASEVEFVADRPGHDRRYAIDATRIRDELGWRPSVAFEAGLASTVSWYRARQDWWGPLTERYGGERLGLAAPTSSRKKD